MPAPNERPRSDPRVPSRSALDRSTRAGSDARQDSCQQAGGQRDGGHDRENPEIDLPPAASSSGPNRQALPRAAHQGRCAQSPSPQYPRQRRATGSRREIHEEVSNVRPRGPPRSRSSRSRRSACPSAKLVDVTQAMRSNTVTAPSSTNSVCRAEGASCAERFPINPEIPGASERHRLAERRSDGVGSRPGPAGVECGVQPADGEEPAHRRPRAPGIGDRREARLAHRSVSSVVPGRSTPMMV